MTELRDELSACLTFMHMGKTDHLSTLFRCIVSAVPENIVFTFPHPPHHHPHERSLEIPRVGGHSLPFFLEGGKTFVTNERILMKIVLTIEKGIEINQSILRSVELKQVLLLTFVFLL